MSEPSSIDISRADATVAQAIPFDRETLETLGRMIDTFVATTVETLCAADAAMPALRTSPVHRTRVGKVMADLEKVEEAVAKLRAMWVAETGRLAPAGEALPMARP